MQRQRQGGGINGAKQGGKVQGGDKVSSKVVLKVASKVVLKVASRVERCKVVIRCQARC